MKNQEEVGGEGGAKALGQKRAWCVREPAGGPDSGSVRRGRENQVQLKKRRGGGGGQPGTTVKSFQIGSRDVARHRQC